MNRANRGHLLWVQPATSGIREGRPLGAHIDQVDENVVGERPRPGREDAVLGGSEVGVYIFPEGMDAKRNLTRFLAQSERPLDRTLGTRSWR